MCETGGANPILGIHAKKEQATAKPIGEAGKSIENKEDKIDGILEKAGFGKSFWIK